MKAGRRLRIDVSGMVQGVGFRPLAHRLARELGLSGWARNEMGGLAIEVEGGAEACAEFRRRLPEMAPAAAVVRRVTVREVERQGGDGFEIRPSEDEGRGAGVTEIVPDLGTCAECLREIQDPGDRRFRYPFTNCTQCGPRFSIVLGMPYDRERTTMRGFSMCAACREEYESAENRRFHAQPNACRDCGPQVAFTDGEGRVAAAREEAMEAAARAIEDGQIVAVKGIGGFHLLADGRSAETIARLRSRKHRPAKPLALLVPDLACAREHCEVGPEEERVLASAEAPIVILARKGRCDWPEGIAPGNPSLGVMLPYAPLHHLLLRRLGIPVVATSGNRGDEPICTGNGEAFARLRGIADAFLVHDRPIARPVDDSVVRVVLGRELMLRRSRGYAPCSVEFAGGLPPVLALGGDQKGSLAMAGPWGVRCGQHLGDWETEAAQEAIELQMRDLPSLCGIRPEAVACDLHPGYHSARMAAAMRLPVERVQHHHAHLAACLAEHGIEEEVLGVAWDGTGYGGEGAIWGGEFLVANQDGFRRVAWLRPFPLPGGALAIRQPRYAALGLLWEAGVEVEHTPLAGAFSATELAVARTQLERRVNTPVSSSAGRLCEAVAALLGLRWENEFEAQAALDLEFAAGREEAGEGSAQFLGEGPVWDWEPVVRDLLRGLGQGVSAAVLAARFWESLSAAILGMAQTAGRKTVVLSGGCFQNVRLLERTVARLRGAGFIPVWPHLVPPNDGGLALGQAVIAGRRRLRNSSA